MPKLERPKPPVFEKVEDERLHRKQRLAAAFRLFARLGFNEGTDGHLTARDPEFTDHFWVNPLGVEFCDVRVSNLVLVNHDGDVVKGDQPINREAIAIHSHIHAARLDAIATVYAHSIYGKAWSTLGRPLDPSMKMLVLSTNTTVYFMTVRKSYLTLRNINALWKLWEIIKR